MLTLDQTLGWLIDGQLLQLAAQQTPGPNPPNCTHAKGNTWLIVGSAGKLELNSDSLTRLLVPVFWVKTVGVGPGSWVQQLSCIDHWTPVQASVGKATRSVELMILSQPVSLHCQ